MVVPPMNALQWWGWGWWGCPTRSLSRTCMAHMQDRSTCPRHRPQVYPHNVRVHVRRHVPTTRARAARQVLCVLGVVAGALAAQLACRPFALERMNGLECVSLAATLSSLYLCCFFLVEDLAQPAKELLSMLVVAINVLAISYFVYRLAAELYTWTVQIVDSDGDGKVRVRHVPAASVHAAFSDELWPLCTKDAPRGPAGGGWVQRGKAEEEAPFIGRPELSCVPAMMMPRLRCGMRCLAAITSSAKCMPYMHVPCTCRQGLPSMHAPHPPRPPPPHTHGCKCSRPHTAWIRP